MPTDLRDRLPIAAYIFSPMGVLVNAASPYRTLRGLIEAARAEPGKITYGSGGIGTSPQLLAEDFASRIGATLLSVPFRGAGETVQALMAGTINMLIASPATALGNLARPSHRHVGIGCKDPVCGSAGGGRRHRCGDLGG